jgi:alkanesulfonate monooxygenase SsuD/methylene tetrahydromethanopterin reductase-like flavin-dependent oxidoreductase (luciferase family)/putative sterol carrier protein
MRFGIFYEHQIPRPWNEHSEEQLLRDALEQVEIADRVGFDVVWEVEHHFLEEYSHSSAPEVFLAAASQRTKRIRLGHGIVQLPNQFNHPARVAERIATLDLISGGRVEFGTGEGSSQTELGGFGVSKAEKRAQWTEALDAVTRMMVEEPFAGYDGKYLRMPPRNVVPKPKQKPHPPLWVACSRRETILLAARKGIGALSFSFIEPEESKEWVDDYYRIIASDECVAGGFSVNPNVAVALPMMCHTDEATAIDRGIDGAHFFGYALSHYYVFGKHRPGETNIWDEFQQRRSEYGFAREIVTADQAPLGVKLLQHGLGSLRGAVGTPRQIADLVQRYEAAGVDQVIFVMQAGRNRHEHICESLELFGREVLPRFAKDAEPKEKAKSDKYAEAASKALARRAPRRTMPGDYVVTTQGEPFETASPRTAPGAVMRFLETRSDSQLDRLLSYPFVLRILLNGLRKQLKPERAPKFNGDIQYAIAANGSRQQWVLSVRNGRASLRSGASAYPKLVVRAPAAVFVRLLTGQMNAGAATLEGKLHLEGDLSALSQLGKMAGN